MASINPAQVLSIGADAIYLSARPLPIALTGYYDWQVTSDPAGRRQGHSAVTNLINQVRPLSDLIFANYCSLFGLGKEFRAEGWIQA